MIRTLIFTLSLICTTAHAASPPASEASIQELLRVTDAKNLVDGMLSQVETMMGGALQQALGRPLTEDEMRAADSMNSNMMRLMRDELSWSNLEPLYLRIYQKSFTQDELDGMVAFYKTPAGIALVKKMPIVMQETMGAMQVKMGPMMQKIQAAVQDTVQEITTAKKKNG